MEKNSDKLRISGFSRSMFDSIVEPHRPVETTMTPGQAVRASAVISNLLRSQRLPLSR
jgi:hypothetical protein